MADRNDATPRVYTLELSGAEVKALVDYHLAQQEEADSSEAGCIGDAQRARQLQAVLDSSGCTRSHPHEEMTVSCLATRRYTMSETHLSGARVIIGFDTVEEASAAHAWIANTTRKTS